MVTNRKFHSSEAVWTYKASAFDPNEIASEKARIIVVELPKVDLTKLDLTTEASRLFAAWMYF
jgi:hypothetical protein